MEWGSFSEFLALGGHGFYVWTAYGGLALLIVLELVSQRIRAKNAAGRVRAESDFETDGEAE